MSAPYDYKALIEGPEDDTPCECSDCEWTGMFVDLAAIEDCSLTPGDPSPAGRCPECDVLAYVVKPDLVAHVVVAGNAFDGLALFGPFDSYDEALTHAEGLVGGEWKVVAVNPATDTHKFI